MTTTEFFREKNARRKRCKAADRRQYLASRRLRRGFPNGAFGRQTGDIYERCAAGTTLRWAH